MTGYYYLSGPMRRYPEYNFPAFEAAQERLTRRGFHIVSPHQHDVDNGFDPTGMTGFEAAEDIGFDIHAALAWDCSVIATPNCEGVIVIDGWQESSGAKVEVALALALGKPIYEYEGDRGPRRIEPTVLVTS